jgi:hypothetical protein
MLKSVDAVGLYRDVSYVESKSSFVSAEYSGKSATRETISISMVQTYRKR